MGHKAYIESSTRADDMKSSAVAFFLVGVLLVGVSFLIYIGKIPFGSTPTHKIINALIILVFAICFFIVALYSSKKEKQLRAASNSEEKLTEEIIEFCLKNHVEPLLTDSDFLENIDEELFFLREEALKNLIANEFKGLSDSYFEYILDIVYGEIYENNSLAKE